MHIWHIGGILILKMRWSHNSQHYLYNRNAFTWRDHLYIETGPWRLSMGNNAVLFFDELCKRDVFDPWIQGIRNQESFIRGNLQYMQFTKGYIQGNMYRVIWSYIHLCGLEISIKASRRYHGNHQEKHWGYISFALMHKFSGPFYQCVISNHTWIQIQINPLHAKFLRENINIYLHFMSFLHSDKTHVVEIPPWVRQGPAYST